MFAVAAGLPPNLANHTLRMAAAQSARHLGKCAECHSSVAGNEQRAAAGLDAFAHVLDGRLEGGDARDGEQRERGAGRAPRTDAQRAWRGAAQSVPRLGGEVHMESA